MNDLIKVMIIVVVIIYIISPVDAAPGPIDDLLVVLLGMAASKKIR